jgi:putative oxidoreductase
MRDLAFLLLRIVSGGLLAGHGAQKLFGSFGGPGLEGMGGFLESMGMKPGKPWAALAGLSEFGGGTLTALGLLNPLGPLGIVGAMTMAALRAHNLRPIWAQEGGAELPVTNAVIALVIALSGPGRYSLDQALEVRVPRWLVVVAFLFGALAAAAGLSAKPDDERGDEDSGFDDGNEAS